MQEIFLSRQQGRRQPFQYPRQDPFQLPPLLYKEPYYTHHIYYGNTKDVFYFRKVYYMNKIYTKLRRTVACLVCVKLKLLGKILTILAANLK